MPVSTEQYEAILARLNKLEHAFNDFAVALNHCATIGQIQQLLAVVQQDLASINNDVDALEERVTAIEEEPLT